MRLLTKYALNVEYDAEIIRPNPAPLSIVCHKSKATLTIMLKSSLPSKIPYENTNSVKDVANIDQTLPITNTMAPVIATDRTVINL